MEHGWNTPYLPSSTHCSYQKDKWPKPGSLPKGNAHSELGEHWIENNFRTSHC